jgi:hypothetical protein
VALLEKSSTEAASKGGCASCHHHNITDIASMAARDKGIPLDEKAAANRRQLTRARFFDPASFFDTNQSGAGDSNVAAGWWHQDQLSGCGF